MKFDSLTELTQWARRVEYLWLFLDYDGTLADFTPTPDQIEPNPRIINLLERLACKDTIRITILSGRRLSDIRLLLPIQGIYLAGSYGLEFVTPSGERIDRVEYGEVRPLLETIKPQWGHLINGRCGFFLEDKGWTLALHARFADHPEAEDVIAHARNIAMTKPLPDIFCLLQGYKFLELAPVLANKKETVTYLLNQYPLPDARLLYLGDDDHDEEAFSAIHANHGVAIKILQPSQRSPSTTADFCFYSPIEALHWLEQLI